MRANGKNCRSVTFVSLLALAVAGTAAAGDRWYTADQVKRGHEVYVSNCAVCHGKTGEGQPNWQERDQMGFYPAPPLNADGHAWHHPLREMMETLDMGGGPSGGTMPSFVDVLDDTGKRAVIAYIQSLWPDEMYSAWAAIDRGEASPPPIAQHE
jgi:mono/diheme cytochrome c family protein